MSNGDRKCEKCGAWASLCFHGEPVTITTSGGAGGWARGESESFGGQCQVIGPIQVEHPKPHKCPVCEGRGEVLIGVGGYSGGATQNCHGCKGLGWVTV
jgi:hypothetical protein